MEVIMTSFVIAAAIIVFVAGGFVVFAKSGKRGSGGVVRVFSRGSPKITTCEKIQSYSSPISHDSHSNSTIFNYEHIL